MLEFELSESEARVLGCLMEKEMTTPEYYPLSLNALVNACNQKSNRNPVVSYDEATVLQALEGLKAYHLAWQSDAARVSKYEHLFGKTFNLVAREVAVICLLLLRGPQTLGELRSRSERMYAFGSLDEIGETMSSLEEMELVRQMPRQPGQKESRFTHLLAGEPEYSRTGEEFAAESPGPKGPGMGKRVAVLEEEIRQLHAEFDELKQAFLDFKGQFE